MQDRPRSGRQNKITLKMFAFIEMQMEDDDFLTIAVLINARHMLVCAVSLVQTRACAARFNGKVILISLSL